MTSPINSQAINPIRVIIAVKVRGFNGCKNKRNEPGIPNIQFKDSFIGNQFATEEANGPVHVYRARKKTFLVGGQKDRVYLTAAI